MPTGSEHENMSHYNEHEKRKNNKYTHELLLDKSNLFLFTLEPCLKNAMVKVFMQDNMKCFEIGKPKYWWST